MKAFLKDAPRMTDEPKAATWHPHGLRYAFKRLDGVTQIGFLGTRSREHALYLLDLQYAGMPGVFERTEKLREAV